MQRFLNGPVATSFFLVSLEYFMVSKLSGYRKNTSYTRSETFHEVCVQGKGVHIDRNTYAYILSIPMGNKNLFTSQSLHISLYFLNVEFPLITTNTVSFSIMFDHCENEIIRIRTRIPFFSKVGKPRLQFSSSSPHLFQIQ